MLNRTDQAIGKLDFQANIVNVDGMEGIHVQSVVALCCGLHML